MNITVRRVETKKDGRKFVEFPLSLYKNNPYFVPPIYSDEMMIFTDKNAYADTCSSEFFLAEDEGKVVGRIQGIIQRQFNEIHNEKRLRFTRFDAINSPEVAAARFAAVEEWGRSCGMDTVCGPLGYSDLEREGLLIEGFDRLSTFEEQYNYEYYASLIEGCGYVKEIDWLEFNLRAPEKKNPVLDKVAARALELNKLHLVDPDKYTKREYVDKYSDGVFECIDRCYSHLYGTVPMTESTKKQILDQFMLIINQKYLIIVADENERVVAFGLCVPSIGKALQKSGGRMTIPTIIRLLKAVKNPKEIDLMLVAVLPEYQSSGVNAVFIHSMVDILESGKVESFETNLNLETNTQVMAQWKYFSADQHKRRRSYVKAL